MATRRENSSIASRTSGNFQGSSSRPGIICVCIITFMVTADRLPLILRFAESTQQRTAAGGNAPRAKPAWKLAVAISIRQGQRTKALVLKPRSLRRRLSATPPRSRSTINFAIHSENCAEEKRALLQRLDASAASSWPRRTSPAGHSAHDAHGFVAELKRVVGFAASPRLTAAGPPTA